jgi:hypothetical protein
MSPFPLSPGRIESVCNSIHDLLGGVEPVFLQETLEIVVFVLGRKRCQ